MRKILTFIFILIVVISIGSLYGILHSCVTYKILSEFYNKYLFYSFGIIDIDHYPKEYIEKASPENPLFEAIKVGIIGTLIYSLTYGLIIAFVGLIHTNNKTYLKVSIKSCLIIFSISLITGLIGYFYGNYFFVSELSIEEFNKNNLLKIIDYKNFLTVNIIRSFSLIGSFLGLIIAIIYSILQKNTANKVLPKRYGLF